VSEEEAWLRVQDAVWMIDALFWALFGFWDGIFASMA